FDWVNAALIGHQTRVKHGANAIVDRGLQGTVRQVDGAARLRTRAIKGERETIALNSRGADDWDGLARETVIVHGALELIDAIGESRDAVAQAATCIGENVLDRLVDCGPAHALDQLHQHGAAANIGTNLGAKVEDALFRIARIVRDQSEQVLINLPCSGNTDDRQADAFLENRTRCT